MKKVFSLIVGLMIYSSLFAGGLITPKELNVIKGTTKIIDYRWDKEPEKTIPGAMVIFNKDISREVENVGGMALSKSEFEALMSSMGIENTDDIAIVDDNGMMQAARLWWIFKLYGHKGELYILDGQIEAWERYGLPMEAPTKPTTTSNYIAEEINSDLTASLAEVKASINDDSMVTLDTRGKMERVRGHVPNSVFIEWKDNLKADGTYKSKEDLAKLYENAGITKDKKVIMPHCKSAVRSAQTMFALVEILGYTNIKNYDGSWIEYEKSGAPKKLGL